MWAIFAAPLLMSVDLRTLKPDYKAILKNRKIIAVNQDPLGIQVGRQRQVVSVKTLTLLVVTGEKNLQAKRDRDLGPAHHASLQVSRPGTVLLAGRGV